MRLLADTTIWADHLRRSDPVLAMELVHRTVLIHPVVIGELACCRIGARTLVLSLLNGLPQSSLATPQEVLHLIESRHLQGRGIGYTDAQLLASCLLDGAQLWTRDPSLRTVAAELDLLASHR